ncbi:bifunctional DNA primase/polymerase [Nocardia sp. GTS18]|uniref:bifunctional DNA primase/polymerase n=1 Tax=Nocardia sp. GTS18 TaxID=1778064 RepID=UPI0015EF25D7|nr:bifunctional DNA primase/polymerase [Nocardia sp. GTS18]
MGEVNKRVSSGAAAHLDFYLDRGCVVVPCLPGKKRVVKGAGEWIPERSKAEREKLTRNAAVRNGTGGILVVDIDAKNGGSLDLMAEMFPSTTMTRTVQTVSPGPHGLGAQLIYALPEGFKIRQSILARNDHGEPMIEVAAFAMLPGSRARGADDVQRFYKVIRDLSPYPATPELLSAVEARVTVETSEPAPADEDTADAGIQLNTLVARVAAAGPGQRNEVFTQYALPIVRLCDVLGEDPEEVLTSAYEESGGTDASWIASAIRSAVRGATGGPLGPRGLGQWAKEHLSKIETWARFAVWSGKTGPSDRRVLLALIAACIEHGNTETTQGKRKLALRAGVSEETVEAALKRLTAQGHLQTLKQEKWSVRRLLRRADDNTHIFPPLVRGIHTTEDLSDDLWKGLGPLHMVWSVPRTDRSPGMDGRHGHLYDLVGAGLTTAKALGDYSGSRPDSLNRPLVRMVEVGLLVKSGREFAPADDAGDLAAKLALELGAVEVCAHRENRYRDDDLKWVEAQRRQREPAQQTSDVQDSIVDLLESSYQHELSDQEKVEILQELAAEAEEERKRREDEQELMRQLGILRDIGI